MKGIFDFIINTVKALWTFFEKNGITIIAISTSFMCVVTIILDVIIFLKKLREDKNLSYAKLYEEIMHQVLNDENSNASNEKNEEHDDVADGEVPF